MTGSRNPATVPSSSSRVPWMAQLDHWAEGAPSVARSMAPWPGAVDGGAVPGGGGGVVVPGGGAAAVPGGGAALVTGAGAVGGGVAVPGGGWADALRPALTTASATTASCRPVMAGRLY